MAEACAEKYLQSCPGRDVSLPWMEHGSGWSSEWEPKPYLDLANHSSILVFDPSSPLLGPPGCRLPDWPRSNVAKVSILPISGYCIQSIALSVSVAPVSSPPTSSPSPAPTVYLMLLHFYLLSNFQAFPTDLVHESFPLCCSNMAFDLIFYFKHIWQWLRMLPQVLNCLGWVLTLIFSNCVAFC